MLDYLTKVVAATNPSVTNAIPYLGTFSRALNAPSWFPEQDATNMKGYYGTSSFGNTTGYFYENPYRDNAELGTNPGITDPYNQNYLVANRDIPNVRWPAVATITHYRDDGTSYTYTVKAGDPMLKHRFSLAKLAWLTTTGPASGISAQAVKDCFGLQWDPESLSSTPIHYDRWKYVAGTVGPTAIKTLAQVASEGREPNFFEMLKEGILSGSLGQSPGPVFTNTTSEGPPAQGLDIYYSEKNRHILQIGANIIDQYDADSIPTAIYMALFTVGNTEQDLVENTVYGDENLPGLTRLYTPMIEDWYGIISTFTNGTNVTTTTNGCAKLWIHPEIWNIHQVPAPNTALTNCPTQFRVHAYGKLSVNFANPKGNVSAAVWGSSYAPAMDYDNPTPYTYHSPADGSAQTISSCVIPSDNVITAGTAANSPANFVYFTNAPTATSFFYTCPLWLTYQYTGYLTNPYFCRSWVSNVPTPLSTFQGTHPLNIFYSPNDYLRQSLCVGGTESPYQWDGNQFVALFCGEYIVPDMTTNSGYIAASLQNSTSMINPLYLSLECQDPNTLHWHPYNFISGLTSVVGNASGTSHTNFYGIPGAGGNAYNGNLQLYNAMHYKRIDPRTDRFSVFEGRTYWSGPSDPPQSTMFYQPSGPQNSEANFPWRNYGFFYSPDPLTSRQEVVNWVANVTNANNTIDPYGISFYIDPDGIVRPGDSYRCIITGSGNSTRSTGDGMPLFSMYNNGHAWVDTTPVSTLPTNTTMLPQGSAQARRPVILNRPFRSVGELGYAYRDLPLKSVDFFSTASGDAALLDLFSIADEPSITAGQVNINRSPAPVLAAIFNGAQKMEINSPATNSNFMTVQDSTKLAAVLANNLPANPICNRSGIVTRYSDIMFTNLITNNVNYANKAYAEAPVRALSNIVNTRTWDLFIDVVAQSGHMSPLAKTLNDFVVEGERRYWLHVTIDRYTGKILDHQLEPIYE